MQLIAGGTEGSACTCWTRATGPRGRTLTAVSQQIMAVAVTVRPDGGSAVRRSAQAAGCASGT